MGSYGANSRLEGLPTSHLQEALSDPKGSQALILEWFDNVIAAISSDDDKMPEKFSIGGYGHGGYLAGLYAAKRPKKVESLLMLAPSLINPMSSLGSSP